MKVKKQTLSVLLVAGLLASSIPFFSENIPKVAITANAASSGTCGDKINWILGYDGTLTISGTGEMTNYDLTTALNYYPFQNNADIKKIVIGNGVTSIGNCAFRGCTSLNSITIPDSVTYIGNDAFYGCNSLTSITIPDSVTSIGIWAFEYTPWIKAKRKENPLVIVNEILIDGSECSGDVVIPDSVTSIADYAFGYCTNLTTITIPEGVTKIGDYAIHTTNKNFSIKGYSGSYAETYAKRKSIKFEAIGTAQQKTTSTTTAKPTTTSTTSTTTTTKQTTTTVNNVSDSKKIKELEDKINSLESENASLKKAIATNTFGDINRDNIIDGRDATVLLTYYAKTSTGYTGTLTDFIESTKTES